MCRNYPAIRYFLRLITIIPGAISAGRDNKATTGSTIKRSNNDDERRETIYVTQRLRGLSLSNLEYITTLISYLLTDVSAKIPRMQAETLMKADDLPETERIKLY